MRLQTELEALPSTAPGLLHGLRTLFDSRSSVLRAEALKACAGNNATRVPVKFFHRCMEVTAYYDPHEDRFTDLRACDIGDVGEEHPTYCITVELRPLTTD